MVRRSIAVSLLIFALTLASATLTAQSKPVSTDDVIAMTAAGLSDQIIIAKIKAQNKPIDLSTEAMVTMKKAKVSDSVITALIDPTAAVNVATPTSVVVSSSLMPAGKPSGATSGMAGDPSDPLSPHDSGIYVFSTGHDGKPTMVILERTAYQGSKTGGMFASAMTYGIAKAKSKAIIPGKAAGIRVGDAQPVFYFYFDDKAAGLGGSSYFGAQNISNPNQFGLVRLEVEKNSRQAEIGEFSMWGASSGNNKKETVPFKSERLKPGLYKVTIDGPLKKGEYCFISAPVATSSYAGIAGTTSATNIFDFGVDN
jgi:hypothetical protein